MHNAFLQNLIEALDWVGTFVFALSGGLLGVQKRFDLFGVLFLSFVVAVAGGMIRDVLIGAVPPAAIIELHYFLIAITGGLITFYSYPKVASCSTTHCFSTRLASVCWRSSARKRQ